ncbi:hypothetical protein C8A05DRAFT_48477 [Staphylotrichum tortipilum]|uniref:Uncharacterized protein n=1 Tax=Staphylotrichum tortipilum TaxID=2831512 RepID=A0AAN6MAE3_9PEZI|nr:hypothetical protein C8A05DRAFT_48477 [Staphylotrichum longicolle]
MGRPYFIIISCDQEIRRAKKEACERVRMENAAKRNKTLPKLYRRAMMAAAVEAKDKAVPNWSICTNTRVSVFDELGEVDERTPVGVDGETDTGGETGTRTDKGEVSPLPTGLKSTPRPKHHEVDATKSQQRQAKSCAGPKGRINEGISLASDEGDVARIHTANRKAWPRGPEPIAADATAEDREIAELVRRGFIGAEDLQVDRDDFGGGVCPYTVRFVEARKKGRKGNNRPRQGVQVAESAPSDAESDWWYLDDEGYAQILSDGGTELVDWSEASSFANVD